jgi:hypothetical protein
MAELRIYCVCGQKMKVSEEMFGRPGKCVACRQKIRIPRIEEMPPNTGEIYLKDHPQFLRKVKRRKSTPPPVEEPEVIPIAEGEARGASRKGMTALDILDPLRALCSLQAKVERQLSALEEIKEAGPKSSATASELLGYRAQIRAAQNDLEEELRQRLMETAIELANTQERIAELNLAVRVGEIDYATYQAQVDRFRRRRDNHERRQVNLRGWLTIDDPHRAGGYVDVPFNQIPKGEFRVTFPNEADDAATLLDWHIEGLRHALGSRAQTERKLAEVKRMKAGPGLTPRTIEECTAEARAELERAQSLVQFTRERLEQLADDYSNDIQAVDAQHDHARGRLQAGQVRREQFNETERDLIRAKSDLTKARALVVRALSANAAGEVPRPRGTFVARLAHGRQEFSAPLEAWLMWIGAALIVISIVLPVAGERSPLRLLQEFPAAAGTAHWLITFPFAIGILLLLSGFIPDRLIRGWAGAGIWLAGCLISALYLHETDYTTGPIAEALRAGGPMLLRAGLFVFVLGLVSTGAAVIAALLPRPESRTVLPFVALAALLAVGGILTDWAGTRVPNPQITTFSDPIPGGDVYRTEVTITNAGGRMMVLASGSTMRNAYDYVLERQSGPESWPEVGPPNRIRLGAHELTGLRADTANVPIRPGEKIVYVYEFEPGQYRVSLLPATRQGSRITRQFSLEPIRTTEAQEPAFGEGLSSPRGEEQPSGALSPALADLLSAEVALRGIIATADRQARFSISVTLNDGRTRRSTYSIGDEVFEGWYVAEFNPQEQTVTLSNGERPLILRNGEPHKIEPVIKDEEPAESP